MGDGETENESRKDTNLQGNAEDIGGRFPEDSTNGGENIATENQTTENQTSEVENNIQKAKEKTAKGKIEVVELTLRGADNKDITIPLVFAEGLTNQAALEIVINELKKNKFGVDGVYNYVEIPYHPKLVGMVKKLKESLPEGSTLAVTMPEDFSAKMINIDKDRLEDFEQADKIIFASAADKKSYIKLLDTNKIPLAEDESKYQVANELDMSNFAKPVNQRNKDAKNSQKSKGLSPKKKRVGRLIT
jgi:hypothetical protein